MKSYEKMTDSVLNKVQLRKGEQKRRNRIIVLTTLGICCFMLVILLAGSPYVSNWNISKGDDPIISETGRPVVDDAVDELVSRLTLLCAVPGSTSVEVMEANVVLPYKAEIRVWNISGMTEEQLLEEILSEERAYKEQMKAIYPKEFNYGRHRRENVVVTTVSAGCFRMEFEDVQLVAQIRATVTENGYLMAYPRTDYGCYSAQGGLFGIDIDGDNFRQTLAMKGNENLEMFWQISPLVADKINADPEMDLTEIKDTITLIVNYTDGREEIIKVNISIDAQGQVSAVREETIVSQISSY